VNKKNPAPIGPRFPWLRLAGFCALAAGLSSCVSADKQPVMFPIPYGRESPATTAGPIKLARGESILAEVYSRNPQGHTGIAVAAGERYSFATLPGENWVDFYIGCSADGYQSHPFFSPQELAKKDKILPDQNWFVLCGDINHVKNDPFPIGTRCDHTMRESGELILFANDATFAYGNNWGAVWVLITRI